MISLFDKARQTGINPHGKRLNRRQRRMKLKEILRDKQTYEIMNKAKKVRVV